ncbi:MAG: ABC transporter permease [candidate division Zixibacteria bacterium]
MFKNYLKVAFRNLLRHKGFSFINIMGLALGFACCVFIFLYINHETSYDSYHPDNDRIFRVAKHIKRDANEQSFAWVNMLVAPTLKETYPEVLHAGRGHRQRPTKVSFEDKFFMEENIQHIEPDLLNILKIDFIDGNPKQALERPNTAIITDCFAARYFGDENPVGKSLLVDTLSYEITGLIKNAPSNTHFKYEFLGSWETIQSGGFFRMGNELIRMAWDMPGNAITYIKLAPGTDVADFENKICGLIHQYNDAGLKERGQTVALFLQPITDIHLHSNMTWEKDPPGNLLYVYIFSAVGILILFIAATNFVNLSTARSTNRSTEVGMRKIIGANRAQLVGQFLGESLLVTILGLIIGLVFAEIALQKFNEISGMSFTGASFFHKDTILFIIGIVGFIGIAAGCYPAFVLSSLKPLSIVKGKLKSGLGGVWMRRISVVFQFAIAVFLIAGTLFVFDQVNFMKNQHLGFDKEQKLIIEMPTDVVTRDSYSGVKSEFLNHPSIEGATFSSSVPGRWRYLWNTYPAGKQETNSHSINHMQVDYDFLSEYDIQLLTGRAFSKEHGDAFGAWIINEAAAKTFGWGTAENALDKHLFEENHSIVGIIKDYHFHGLQEAIGPLALFPIGDDFRYLSLRVETNELSETVANIKTTYEELFPGTIFNYFFLDKEFNLQYRREEQIGSLFGWFTSLGIFIACLGLFGLSSFLTEQRTKEIGIRKVLGASISGIVRLMTKEYIWLVIISNVIAMPIAWYAMNRWLDNFAYRIEIGWETMAYAGISAIIIAVATVSFQAIKAALANPVESIKYE